MTHLLNLLAAIALLVWGTHLVRTGVLRVLGSKLRQVLAASMGNRFTAAGDGDNQRIVRRGQVSSHEDELAPAEQDFCRALLARYDYEARIASLLAETALVRPAREENAR